MNNLKALQSTKDVELIKAFYSGINRFDVPSVLALMNPNILRFEFNDSPLGGTFRGLTELKHNLVSGRSNWTEGACEPISFYSDGSKIIVEVHIKVRLKNHTDWIDARSTDGFLIQDNQVFEFHSFSTKQMVLEWVASFK